MPRKSTTDQRRNQLLTMITDDELALVDRVAKRYGMSRSSAARLLILAGAPQHDPSPPTEGK